MNNQKFISRFSPNRTSPEDLEQINVQRHELLKDILSKIEESVRTKNKHHLLFVGPRGCGKTHLLCLISYRRNQREDLKKHLRIAWLNEDETSTTLLDILVRIYRALAESYPEEFPCDELKPIFKLPASEAQSSLGKALVKKIGQNTVLILVENLDSLFRNLKLAEQRKWRAFIQNHPVFTTVATAQSLFDGVSKRDLPFFGFFDTQHLDALTVDQAAELLSRIAHINNNTPLEEFLATPQGKARVHAIHHLSGGNHRLYIVLSDFINKESLEELVRPFEIMVDEQLTPYYQERLRWLSALQRKVVELLCFQNHPVSVKEIASKLFSSHSTIAGQLKKLLKMRYVSNIPQGREVFYELSEPLMRLSMQVKETEGSQPLGLIVDFLRVWYEKNELQTYLSQIADATPVYNYLIAALAKLESGEPNLRHEILRRGLIGVDATHCSEHQFKILQALAAETERSSDYLKLGGIALQRDDYEIVKIAYAKVQSNSTDENEKGLALLWFGVMQWHENDKTRAIESFSKIIGIPGILIDITMAARAARGKISLQVGKVDAAIEDFTKIIQWADIGKKELVETLLDRVAAFKAAEKPSEAVIDCSRIIEMGEIRIEYVCRALLLRGCLLLDLDRQGEAEADFTRIIEIPSAPADRVLMALLNRSIFLFKEKKYQLAIADATRVIESSDAASMQLNVALVVRCSCLMTIQQMPKALADIVRVQTDNIPPELTVSMLNIRGMCLILDNQHKSAVECFSKIVQSPLASRDEIIAARGGLAYCYFHEHQWELAFDQIARFSEKNNSALAALRFAASGTVNPINFNKISSHEIDQVLKLYANFDSLVHLGNAIVKNMSSLLGEFFNFKAMDQWFLNWKAAASQYKDMEVSLRLVEAGIAYLKTEPKDESVLLQLPKEERQILREALNLTPENSQ